MKRFSLVALLVIASLILSLAPISPSLAAANNSDSRIILAYKPGFKGHALAALQQAGANVHFNLDNQNAFAVTLPQAALNGLQNAAFVDYIEEDAPRYPISIIPSKQSVQTQAVSVPAQVVPYGVDMVQARQVWDANQDNTVDSGAPTGAGIKICIIDSGFYTAHEDLQGVNVGGYNGNLPWNVDGAGHGTHVAGTITAVNNALGVLGVLPGTATIYEVRVFGDDGAWAYSSTLVDAANRCAAAGAKIISMSLGGTTSNNTEKNTFASLYSQGILPIAAAGNDGNNRMSYPASYDSVLSVAAIDSTKTVATFSQYNSAVDIAAPGVGVLSTVPYKDISTVTAGGKTYEGTHVEFAGRGAVSGALVDGGICSAAGAWTGKVVLCQRGTNTFAEKINNVAAGGGTAALIYNNVAGVLNATMGTGSSSTLVAIGLSDTDGAALVALAGSTASVSSTCTAPASSYEYYDGTSMATPHVSAVAALVWSSKPSATAAQVRNALISTAEDLGAAGRDNYYGAGLVRAKNAIAALAGTSSATVSVKDLDAAKTLAKTSWKATVTITVKNNSGAAVSGAVVTGSFSGTAVSCTTSTAGTCSVTVSLKNAITSVTYTVSNITATGYTYSAAGNSDVEGDSNGTTITIVK